MTADEEILKVINAHPDLISAFCDMGLMPEQLERGSTQWSLMMAYASFYMAGYNAGRDSVPLKEVAF